MIPDQYPNYYKVLEIYSGYFDSLDIMTLFSYPNSIVLTRDYCTLCLQKINRTAIRPRANWAVSLVIADGHYNLPQGFVYVSQ